MCNCCEPRGGWGGGSNDTGVRDELSKLAEYVELLRASVAPDFETFDAWKAAVADAKQKEWEEANPREAGYRRAQIEEWNSWMREPAPPPLLPRS